MAKITGIEIYPLLAKFKEQFNFSGIARVSSNNIIIKVATDEGVYGWGEACPVPGMSGETAVSICSVIRDFFTPLLLGKNPLQLAVITTAIEKCIGSNVVAKAGINIALYDLAGKLLNVPVHMLLGGKYRDEVEINGSVGIGSAEEMLRTCEKQIEEAGLRYLKLYCGKDEIDRDVQKLKKIICGLNGKARVFLDVNQQWTPKDAIRAIRAMEEENLLYVEQPTPRWDLSGMRLVKESVTTPIAADEAVFSLHDISLLGLNRAVDIIAIYALKPGGILRGHDAITLSGAMGFDCFIGSYLELGVGTAAGVHLAASIPNLRYPCYMFGPLKYQQDVLQEPLYIADGKIKVPNGPGLGVEVDEAKLRDMAIEQ